jgi:hypothetical protein
MRKWASLIRTISAGLFALFVLRVAEGMLARISRPSANRK